MQSVNYNEISKTYDDVREGDQALIRHLIQALPPHPDLRILDLGCGTGNYTNLFHNLTQLDIYGVDPSEGMLEKARLKNKYITFKSGQADHIPFEAAFFDFVYMTDVIHHIPDMRAMFIEIRRVLKVEGKGCIVTQSHQQIAMRPIARYFPGTVRVDQERYPDIDEIIGSAKALGFKQVESETLSEKPFDLDTSYLELVRKKGYSMLHLISDDEYQAGLRELELTLQSGPVTVLPSASTLIWFTRA